MSFDSPKFYAFMAILSIVHVGMEHFAGMPATKWNLVIILFGIMWVYLLYKKTKGKE